MANQFILHEAIKQATTLTGAKLAPFGCGKKGGGGGKVHCPAVI